MASKYSKLSRKAAKAQKNITKVDKKVKKKKRTRKETLAFYINKILKQYHPGIGISTNAWDVICSYMDDVFEPWLLWLFAQKRSTIISRNIQLKMQWSFSFPVN